MNIDLSRYWEEVLHQSLFVRYPVSEMKRKDLSPLVVTTVFISSTARDLHAYRQAIAWIQENEFGVTESFPEQEWSSVTTPEEIIAECRKRVWSSDAVVLLLGPWAGWFPPGYTKSITHHEFQWARARFAELNQSINRLAKERALPELVHLYDVPRILVLKALDPGQAFFIMDRELKPLFGKFTEKELKRIRTSLASFHREVQQAVDAHEARLYTFNQMEDMQRELIRTMKQWYSLSALCLPLLSY
jgi:hypothetical protein